MKTSIIHQFLTPTLIAALNLLPAGRVPAQTFRTLFSFTGPHYDPNSAAYTNSDGAAPVGLILSGNTLYGTADRGGSSGYGTVFAINIDGAGFANLHGFTASDGTSPYAGLILSSNTLYGTTYNGMFAVNTDGTGFTNLHSLSASYAGLLLSGNTLYGTTFYGGSYGFGTVFAANTDGTGFTNLHSFTVSDGTSPYAGLILSSNILYGTTVVGGTVFKLNTDSTGFTNLHIFTGGELPYAGLIVSGNTLYGTTTYGGSGGVGTVFAVNTDGTGFTNLHSFAAGSGSGPVITNSDGALPKTGLLLSGNTLYGTTASGGSSAYGTLFALNTDGTGFTNLHIFTGSDGGGPGGLILSGNTLYGTAGGGGSWGAGTVFSLSFPQPQLTITSSGTNVILSWPASVAGFDYTGYTLQSTTNLLSPAVWITNSPPPVVINGQNTVTNRIAGAQLFFRLVQ